MQSCPLPSPLSPWPRHSVPAGLTVLPSLARAVSLPLLTEDPSQAQGSDLSFPPPGCLPDHPSGQEPF